MSTPSTQRLQPMPAGRHRGQAGFTLIEIIIAFIIIGILTAILVPTVSRRSEQAKINAAQTDIQHLCDAEERCAIDIGTVVQIYALNDVVRALESPPFFGDRVNGVHQNQEGENLFIGLQSQDFLELDQQRKMFIFLSNQPETDYGGVKWRGPYINWSRDVNANDWPDDPWGNDYLLFSRTGLLVPPNHQDFQGGGSPFDRFTILSLGANGTPGDTGDPTYGKGDDVFRQFGGS